MKPGLKSMNLSMDEKITWILNDPNGYIDYVLTEAHQTALEKKIKRKTKSK